MEWYYDLDQDTPGFSFTKDDSTVENYGKGGTQHFETNNPCEMVRFIQSHVANPREKDQNFFESLETASRDAGCPISFDSSSAIQPQPSATAPAVDGQTPSGDNSQQQGAPDPVSSGRVGTRPDVNSTDGDPTSPTDEPRRPPEGTPHDTLSDEQPQIQTDAGDPVDIFSGSLYLQETDFEIPNTIIPLTFIRFYKSGTPSFGPFGWNWDHNFNLFIRELNNGDVALWRNLHEEIFKYNGVEFEPQRGVFEILERVSGLAQVFEIKGQCGVLMHFERPSGWIDGERIPLIWIKDRHGNQLHFKYGAEDKLREVRDDDDRFFKFDYDECGLLVAVSDHSGRVFLYEHNEETMQLVYVKSPATTDHPNGTTRIYHYEQSWLSPVLRHNILRVEDAEGNTYVENTYEQDPSSWSFGRITEQLYGGYLYQFQYTQLQWVPANSLFINIPALRVEVMNPDFGLETYTFNYRGDLLDRRYRLKKDNSYRVVVWQYEFDEQGNSAKTTRPDGSEEINIFDFINHDPRMRNKILQKEVTSASGFPSPSRIIWRGRYEPLYQLLIEEKNETGVTITSKYDFNLTPASLSNSGKLIELIQPNATLPDGSVQTAKTVYEYNAKGQLTASILPNGVRNELIYGTSGIEKSRVIKLVFDVHGLNVNEQIKYNTFGFESEHIDRNGNVTKLVINALGLLEKTILPEVNGAVSEYILHYNSDKKVISSKRPKGNFNDTVVTGDHIIDKVERDVLGYPTKYQLSSNTNETRVLKVNNNYRGFPIETINPDTSKSIRTYDERGLLLNEKLKGVDGKILSTKRVYNRSGMLIQETTVNELNTKYELDGFSRIRKVILPNGSEIRNKWLLNDLLESEEVIGDDGTGTIKQLTSKSYAYDEKNRMITETCKIFGENPDDFVNVTSTYYYDNMDRVEKMINNRGGITTIQYDTLGRLSTVTDPLGNKEHHFYDNIGNLIKTEINHVEEDDSVSVFVKKFEYDSRNRRKALIEPDGAKVISKYDDRNLLIRLIDQQGINKEMSYNSFNDKVREVEDAGGLNVANEWIVDNMSKVTSYIDPMGQMSHYEYDSVGNNIKISLPSGFISRRAFNNKNQLVNETLGSGVEMVYEYDNSNRVLKIKNTVSPIPILRIQDHVFTYDGLDRVLSAEVGSNLVERIYDSQDRLLKETNHGKTIKCTYNDAFGEVEKKWPDGRTEKLYHNLNGVLVRIDETLTGTLGSGNNLLANFQLSGPSFLGEAIYNEEIFFKNSFDERKRLSSINATSWSGLNESVKYLYNTSNQKQVEAINGTNSKFNIFEYDSKYRLLQSKDGFVPVIPTVFTQSEHDNAINAVKSVSHAATHQEDFTYNKSDARLNYLETGAPDKDYTYLPGYQINSDGANTYSHYTDGTLNNDGVFSYEADALGRVVRISSATDVVTEINYDAFGRPSILKEFGRPNRSFNYLGGFIEQENEGDIPVRQTTLHPVTGVPIAYHSLLGTHFPFFDNRFNLIALIDDNGNLLESYRYKSFGQPQIFNASGISIADSEYGVSPIFGGQQYLSVTSLYLSKKRLMNPENGVYLSLDPKGYIDSSSQYVYSAQNPINNIDPNGEIIPLIIGVFVIGGALAGAGYSFYDAYKQPEKYEGWQGSLRTLGNVFGGAVIGGAAILGGEYILAAGGTGILATGSTSTAASLTAAQTFVLYGTSSAATGSILRGGFNSMFPDYVDPISYQSIATDYVAGGTFGVIFRGLGVLANRPNKSWTLQGDRDAILSSQRIWGQTEGSVYVMDTPNLPTLRATGGGTVSPNSAIFEFEGVNNIFKAHEVTGPFSLIKRLLGQGKSGFGDITFEAAEQIGQRVVNDISIPIYRITGAQLMPGQFAGQSYSWALTRLWGRRSLDALLGAGFAAAIGLNIQNEVNSESNHPNFKPPSAK